MYACTKYQNMTRGRIHPSLGITQSQLTLYNLYLGFDSYYDGICNKFKIAQACLSFKRFIL